MKKFALFITTLLFSVTVFAQKVSITDFCYDSGDVISTFNKEDVVRRLKGTGFTVIKAKIENLIGPGGALYPVKTYILYRHSTNTKVEMLEYPESVTFNSTSEATAFIQEALNIGYIRRGHEAGYYSLSRYDEYCGIEGVFQRGRVILFDYSIP